MAQTKFRYQSIFDVKTDFLLFAAPVLFAWTLALTLPQLGKTSIIVALFIFSIMSDHGHVWATLIRAYGSKQEFRKRPVLYTLTPIICFGVSFATAYHSLELFFQLFMYFNLWHHVRQQYGWMMLTARKEPPLKKFDQVLDKLIIYGVGIYPLIWWHFHDKGYSWRGATPYLALPAWIEPIALFCHWSIVAIYLGRQFILYSRNTPVNLTKQLIWISTWAMMYPTIVISQSALVFLIVTNLTHGLPYIYLIYHYSKKQFDQESVLHRVLNTRAGYLWYLLFIALLGGSGLLLVKALPLLPGLSVPLTSALITLPPLIHFALDGFIWKSPHRSRTSSMHKTEAIPGDAGAY